MKINQKTLNFEELGFSKFTKHFPCP